MELNHHKLIDLYKVMLKIRMFEEKVLALGAKGLVRSSFHLYLGQEAVAAGACAVLKEGDCITSTHRGHGHCLAKGGDLGLMMAELMGKVTGYCKGKGGSMHIADMDIGILGANGIVGGGIPLATGAALAARVRMTGQAVICFFGDGAANQGCFYESMNLASIWKLPVVYICENNMYALTTPCSEALAGNNLVTRAQGFNMPGLAVDGNDVISVYNVAKEAVEMARAGGGPTLIEAKTYRWEGHWQGDPCVYRTKEEVEEWKKKCPVKRYKKWLLENKIFSEKEAEKIYDEIGVLVNEAEEFAIKSPQPGTELLLTDIYGE